MGRSKAEMFLDAVAAAAAPVFDAVFAVERAGGVSRSIPTIFENDHEESGAIFGVLRALEHADGRCFVLAVDYARITSSVLADLRARAEKSQAMMVVPVWRGIAQPLCAAYAPPIAVQIRNRIAAGHLNLIGLASEARADMFTYDAPDLININSPEDMDERGLQ